MVLTQLLDGAKTNTFEAEKAIADTADFLPFLEAETPEGCNPDGSGSQESAYFAGNRARAMAKAIDKVESIYDGNQDYLLGMRVALWSHSRRLLEGADVSNTLGYPAERPSDDRFELLGALADATTPGTPGGDMVLEKLLGAMQEKHRSEVDQRSLPIIYQETLRIVRPLLQTQGYHL